MTRTYNYCHKCAQIVDDIDTLEVTHLNGGDTLHHYECGGELEYVQEDSSND